MTTNQDAWNAQRATRSVRMELLVSNTLLVAQVLCLRGVREHRM
jgi:hypothetical protein